MHVEYQDIPQENNKSLTSMKYVLSDVKINAKQTNKVSVSSGGTYTISANFIEFCKYCGDDSLNQIIIGLSKDLKAQACIWNGSSNSNGVVQQSIKITVPDEEGIYYIRAMHTQDYTCSSALSKWDANKAENIGYIIVDRATSQPQEEVKAKEKPTE